jgi:hypothetical protein
MDQRSGSRRCVLEVVMAGAVKRRRYIFAVPPNRLGSASVLNTPGTRAGRQSVLAWLGRARTVLGLVLSVPSSLSSGGAGCGRAGDAIRSRISQPLSSRCAFGGAADAIAGIARRDSSALKVSRTRGT